MKKKIKILTFAVDHSFKEESISFAKANRKKASGVLQT